MTTDVPSTPSNGASELATVRIYLVLLADPAAMAMTMDD